MDPAVLSAALSEAEDLTARMRTLILHLHHSDPCHSLAENAQQAHEALSHFTASLDCAARRPEGEDPWAHPRDDAPEPCNLTPACRIRGWCMNCAPRTARASLRISALLTWWGASETDGWTEQHTRILRVLTGRDDDE